MLVHLHRGWAGHWARKGISGVHEFNLNCEVLELFFRIRCRAHFFPLGTLRFLFIPRSCVAPSFGHGVRVDEADPAAE